MPATTGEVPDGGDQVKQPDALFVEYAVAVLEGRRTDEADALAVRLEAALELPEGSPERDAAVRQARGILHVDEYGNRL